MGQNDRVNDVDDAIGTTDIRSGHCGVMDHRTGRLVVRESDGIQFNHAIECLSSIAQNDFKPQQASLPRFSPA